MAYANREKPGRDEFNRPIPKGKDLPPLEFLPEREWLKGQIAKVDYEYVYFQGKQQYVTSQKTGEPVLDEDGNPIPRRQFNIVINLKDYQLPNGEPRKAWIRLGASLNKKANLPKFLIKMELEEEEPTPATIISHLEGADVKFQMANIVGSNGQEYQQVVWDSVKLDLGA